MDFYFFIFIKIVVDPNFFFVKVKKLKLVSGVHIDWIIE